MSGSMVNDSRVSSMAVACSKVNPALLAWFLVAGLHRFGYTIPQSSGGCQLELDGSELLKGEIQTCAMPVGLNGRRWTSPDLEKRENFYKDEDSWKSFVQQLYKQQLAVCNSLDSLISLQVSQVLAKYKKVPGYYNCICELNNVPEVYQILNRDRRLLRISPMALMKHNIKILFQVMAEKMDNTNLAHFVKGHEQSEHNIKFPSRGVKKWREQLRLLQEQLMGCAMRVTSVMSIMERLINLNKNVATFAKSGSGRKSEIAKTNKKTQL
ncbi:hypothetical protein BC830DRAFT_1220090 [Chytriomyces sp. MP71]|nr:hypothetical protein BC830DRAFT_1220090 [Chytriomyces sp. MP71]